MVKRNHRRPSVKITGDGTGIANHAGTISQLIERMDARDGAFHPMSFSYVVAVIEGATHLSSRCGRIRDRRIWVAHFAHAIRCGSHPGTGDM